MESDWVTSLISVSLHSPAAFGVHSPTLLVVPVPCVSLSPTVNDQSDNQPPGRPRDLRPVLWLCDRSPAASISACPLFIPALFLSEGLNSPHKHPCPSQFRFKHPRSGRILEGQSDSLARAPVHVCDECSRLFGYLVEPWKIDIFA
jgi:hypothetical protein